MSRTLTLVLLLAAAALVLRLPRLEHRPMHNDEAVNAIKFGRLWEQGTYKYDPNEHHGPSLYYATLLLGRLTGAPDFDHYSENRLRLVTVLFGVGLVLLVPLLGDGLGRQGVSWAGLFAIVSPAMVFYSRYYIHEMLLVFFTMLALAAGWRYWRLRRLGWALLAGAALGLMSATKETFVITLGAAALALFLNQAWNRALDASAPPFKALPLNLGHLAAALGVWVVVALLLFSSFLTNASGPLDAVRTYLPWLHRAAGESPHIHPWHFYLHRLLWFHEGNGPRWTEVLIFVLALIAAHAGFARRRLGGANASFVRFLVFYTFLLTAFYSLIAYKTPWCLLNFWLDMILLAGIGVGVLLRVVRRQNLRLTISFLLIAGAGHLTWQTWLANTTYAAASCNPYVYAQTSPDILNLVTRVESLADVHPQGRAMVIKVMAPEGDYWPLPWYLRTFKHVGWYDKLPEDPFAPVMIVSTTFQAGLDEKKTHVMPQLSALRPGVFLELYVQTELWRDWLAKHPAKPE
ncbi:MAG TPA: flippase activity-associated protein Agl23 [Candidatus Binatia bacterium]|jgi:uncharacterized protein (TIGR03663 family)|nr:flippase activity-associated protein Agl23 [Candidatus Binatia bacterium]